MASQLTGPARWIAIALFALVFGGLIGSRIYVEVRYDPAAKKKAANERIAAYLASIAAGRVDDAWQADTSEAYKRRTSREEHRAHWAKLVAEHGAVAAPELHDRSANFDYSRVWVTVNLHTADAHYVPNLQYDLSLQPDGTMKIDSGCELRTSMNTCTHGAW